MDEQLNMIEDSAIRDLMTQLEEQFKQLETMSGDDFIGDRPEHRFMQTFKQTLINQYGFDSNTAVHLTTKIDIEINQPISNNDIDICAKKYAQYANTILNKVAESTTVDDDFREVIFDIMDLNFKYG